MLTDNRRELLDKASTLPVDADEFDEADIQIEALIVTDWLGIMLKAARAEEAADAV